MEFNSWEEQAEASNRDFEPEVEEKWVRMKTTGQVFKLLGKVGRLKTPYHYDAYRGDTMVVLGEPNGSWIYVSEDNPNIEAA